MPTYQYKCKECGHLFEIFHSMSAEPIKICPKCNGEVKRLIGPGAGPIFKGTGFYQTDYKNKGSKPPVKTENSPVKTENSPAKTEKPQKTVTNE